MRISIIWYWAVVLSYLIPQIKILPNHIQIIVDSGEAVAETNAKSATRNSGFTPEKKMYTHFLYQCKSKGIEILENKYDVIEKDFFKRKNLLLLNQLEYIT
jgi:hypothetical protein